MTDITATMEIAVQHHRAGRLEQAEELYRRLLQSNPNYPAALNLLGVIAHQRGQHEIAVDLIGKAIRAEPRIPQFHNNIGVAFAALGRFKEAIDAYDQAILLRPDHPEALNNMGNALQALGEFDAAVEKYRRAVLLKPNYAEAYNNIGMALRKQGRYAEAVKNCTKAIRLKPNCAEAYNTMASALRMQGRHLEAVENYRRTLQLKPDYAEVHTNLGMTLLLSGRFEEGWAEYRWRVCAGNVTYPHRYEVPRWDGSLFKGKRLLVHYEQGFGDTLQFVRYLPMVKQRGGTVIFEARKPLIGLLRRFPGIDELVEASFDAKPAVEFDLYASVLDLPGLFETTLATIPADVPYLYADSAKAEYWRNRLSDPYFKVGIVWSGKPTHRDDRNRSCLLKHFAPLAQIPSVRLYGLQKGQAAAQVNELAEIVSITDLAGELEDFTDTAAVLENLDLVVSVDTAVLHLAAAMAKPVWALLPFAPDWRWMLDREDSPWYPTMRLFRQKKTGDWENVFQDMAEQLRMLVAGTRPRAGNSKAGRGYKEKVPVIIPAYKGKEQLERCVAHLRRQTVPVEIFIRDNNQNNIYFTAAINEGIKRFLDHDSKYILILNQDMYLEPDAVEEMVRFMESHPKCGIGTPLQLSSKNPGYVVHAGCFEAFPTGQHQHGWLSEFTNDEQVFWGNGACMILRKEMIQEIGLLDRNFVLVDSDTDYCFTAKARGWQVWRAASARGIHEGGASGVLADLEFEKLKINDVLYFAKKWLTGGLYKELSYEGKNLTPEVVARLIAEYVTVKTELENSTSQAGIGTAAVDSLEPT
jgi:tetratricopeptide (TPR) repeat protein/GT2 family glycosyltransferase